MFKTRIVAAVLLLGLVVAGILVPQAYVSAAADANAEICQTINGISPDGGTCNDPSGPSVNRIVTLAINLLSIVAGVIAVIMLVVSGLKYVMSQGDANQISSAKRSLIFAIVGMAVVAFSQMLVKFVLSKAN